MSADAVAIAQALIRCPSVTPVEGGALAYLEQVLGAAGFTVERMTFSEPGFADVENLYAKIGSGAPHLTFAGHTDVVPPGDVDRWTHAPFSGDIVDGVLYGRGAADMKGGVAAFVAAALDFVRDRAPKGTISLLITGDEEGVAVNGTTKLLDWAAARGERFDHCIVGEPTNPEQMGDMVKIGRRGSLSGTIVVTGIQGHAAYPHRARNPIRDLAPILTALMAEPLDRGTAHFDPSNMEFVSVDVGNPAFNVIPAEARARFNIRFNDTYSSVTLRAEIEARCARAAADGTRWRVDWEPRNAEAFLNAPGPFTDLVTGVIAEVTGRTPVLSTSGGTSDARFIRKFCPVLEFGLVGQTMHQVDERVATADIVSLARIYRAILERYFAAPPS